MNEWVGYKLSPSTLSKDLLFNEVVQQHLAVYFFYAGEEQHLDYEAEDLETVGQNDCHSHAVRDVAEADMFPGNCKDCYHHSYLVQGYESDVAIADAIVFGIMHNEQATDRHEELESIAAGPAYEQCLH